MVTLLDIAAVLAAGLSLATMARATPAARTMRTITITMRPSGRGGTRAS